MKNKIILFAIIILLPNLTLACGGGSSSYIGGVLQGLLSWIASIYCAVFLIGLIILNLFLAFKKDQENKRSNWWMVFVVLSFVLNLYALFIFFNFIVLISFVALFIANIILAFKENKGNKRLEWWMVLAVVLFVCFLFAIVFIKAQQSMLCGSSANF